MYNADRRFASCIIGFLLLGPTGCAHTKPSRFYVLSAECSRDSQTEELDLTVGIGPIDLPEYLDRPQIVTRAGDHRLELAEFDRWAEPLEQNFARVFAEDLSSLLSTDRVVLYPWKGSNVIDRQVTVSVVRFDAAMGDAFVLRARWSVQDSEGRVLVPIRATTITESMAQPNYESLAQAASRAVGQLCRQIAGAVREIPRPMGPGDDTR